MLEVAFRGIVHDPKAFLLCKFESWVWFVEVLEDLVFEDCHFSFELGFEFFVFLDAVASILDAVCGGLRGDLLSWRGDVAVLSTGRALLCSFLILLH